MSDPLVFWTATLAISGLAGAVIGAVAVLLSGRRAEDSKRKAAEASATAYLNSGSVEILKFLADHPRLYDYFYSKKPVPEDSDLYVHAMIAAEMVATYAELILRQIRSFQSEDLEKPWRSYAHFLCQSRAVHTHIADHPDWYTQELRELSSALAGEPARRG